MSAIAASEAPSARSSDVIGAATAAGAAREGVLAMAPLVVGYLPFALVIGATIAERRAGVAGWAGSWLIFGGSAHLAAIRTLSDAGALMAILTGLLINARLLVYSAGLARTWAAQPRWFRVAAACLIIDPTFAAVERHASRCVDPRQQRRFFAGAALTLGFAWSTAIAAGAVIGSRLDGIDLEIVVPLCLLALIGDGLRSGSTRAVVLAAAPTAVIASRLPAGTGLLVAILAGVIAGALWDRRSRA